MKKSLFVVLSVFLSSFLWSQTSIIPSPVVIHCESAKDGDIFVSELNVDVQIAGNIATTSVDMIVNNKSNLTLEGELEFPLNQNQYLVGYSLDIDGRMREGVVVEKEKGRIAFEDKVRQGIDPGLVEMTSGNNFKTRVYPLPAKGFRKIQIVYEEELLSNIQSSDFKRKYVLPVLVQNKLEKFSFNLDIISKTQEKKDGLDENIISLSDWNSGNNYSFNKKNYNFSKPIVVEIPQIDIAGEIFAEDSGTDTIFYYSIPLSRKTIEKSVKNNLTVYWDVSSSAVNRDLARELKLLKSYLSEKILGKVEIILFSNEIIDSKIFNVKSFDKIQEYILKAPLDGGTCFSCLDFNKRSISSEEILFFSDGLENWGRQMGQSNLSCQMGQSNLSVSTVSSSGSSDYGFLKFLAKNNNGSFIDLQSFSDADALNQLKKEPFRLVKLEYDKKLFDEIYPSEGTEISGDFSLSGVMKKKTGRIKISFGYGNKITEQIEIDMHDKWDRVNWNDTSTPFVSRLWAQKKIEELSYDYDNNQYNIVELAKKYGIVTKDTSLIVLESAQDYAKYGILPPVELQEEYYRLVKNQPKYDEKNEISKNVINCFNDYKKWWNTKPGDFKKQNKKTNESVILNEESREMLYSPSREEMNTSIRINNSARTAYFDGDTFEAIDSFSGINNMIATDTNNHFDDNSKINIQSWNPKSDYISQLKRVSTDKMYELYLDLKTKYHLSPSFYMEVADYFWKENHFVEAMRILSNLAELNLENTDVLRALGNKLCQMGQSNLSCQMGQTNSASTSASLLAISIYKKMIKVKPEIPLFYRDLAKAYEQAEMYQEACDSLYKIATGKWDSRYSEIEQIALNDMNGIINRHKKEINVSKYDKRILEAFPVDMRVVLTWNTDDCDIDLWVTDPNGEKCYYGHKLTELGGRNSRDFTQGYGPEEFCLKSAINGKYIIEANYYGTRKQSILQPVIVHAEVYTNFGKSNQTCELLTLQLDSVKGKYAVGDITF